MIEQDKELVGETLEMLQTCYQQLGKTDEWEAFTPLRRGKHRRDSRPDAGADPEQREGAESAQNYVTRQLERHPTMRVFHKLIDYHINEAEEGRAKESLGVLRHMVGEQVRSKPRYRCQKCGFTAHTLYWHCPSCRSWSSIAYSRTDGHKLKTHFSYNILKGFYVISSGFGAPSSGRKRNAACYFRLIAGRMLPALPFCAKPALINN